MKIIDAHESINGNGKVIEIDSGIINILSDSGRTMFSISLKDNVLEISSGMLCKHNGKLLDDSFVIRPKASNLVEVIKNEYKD